MQEQYSTEGKLVQETAYGENAWQKPAGLYAAQADDPLGLHRFKVIEGSSPSYNNWAEIDRQLQTITHVAAAFATNGLDVPAIAVGTKHGNPCGAAANVDPRVAIQSMLVSDARAIFGGLVMLNTSVDEALAEVLIHYEAESGRRLLDAVTAPSFTDGAIKILARKSGKCRCLANPALAQLGENSLDTAPRMRYVRGGFMMQPNYTFVLHLADCVGADGLSQSQQYDAFLAWAVGSTSNSNTVTLVAGGQLIGNGVGQQDRVSCCELAIKRATDGGHAQKLKGAVAYSDSFFPFADGPQVLIDAGIQTIVATSGSVRDDEVRTVCEKQGVSLVQLPDTEGRGFFGH